MMRRTPSFLKMISVFFSLSLFLLTGQAYASGASRPDLGPDAAAMTDATTNNSPPMSDVTESPEVSSAYSHIDPEKIVPEDMLSKALSYFDKNKSRLKNQDYIVIIDYKPHNTKERFFLVDMSSGHVEPYLVAHGKGSDPNFSGYASKFSDTDGSLMSSLGFFITAETYYGSNGFSLKLDGQSPTNASARSRAIVIHGAPYVTPGSVGRSWGCPALEMRHYEDVIEKIKGGALVYSAV